MEILANDADKKKARHLHAVLLFDLVVNHIFLFLMSLTLISQSRVPMIVMVVIFHSCSAISSFRPSVHSPMKLPGMCAATGSSQQNVHVCFASVQAPERATNPLAPSDQSARRPPPPSAMAA